MLVSSEFEWALILGKQFCSGTQGQRAHQLKVFKTLQLNTQNKFVRVIQLCDLLISFFLLNLPPTVKNE